MCSSDWISVKEYVTVSVFSWSLHYLYNHCHRGLVSEPCDIPVLAHAITYDNLLVSFLPQQKDYPGIAQI